VNTLFVLAGVEKPPNTFCAAGVGIPLNTFDVTASVDLLSTFGLAGVVKPPNGFCAAGVLNTPNADFTLFCDEDLDFLVEVPFPVLLNTEPKLAAVPLPALLNGLLGLAKASLPALLDTELKLAKAFMLLLVGLLVLNTLPAPMLNLLGGFPGVFLSLMIICFCFFLGAENFLWREMFTMPQTLFENDNLVKVDFYTCMLASKLLCKVIKTFQRHIQALHFCQNKERPVSTKE
jgi:hypothetical protein